MASHKRTGWTQANSSTLAQNFPPRPRRRQLLVDVSTLAQRDAGTGIQRVTRSVLREWLLDPPQGWSVEAVYATAERYCYARRFTRQFLTNGSTSPEPRLYRYARYFDFTGHFLVKKVVLSHPRVYRYVHRIAGRLLGIDKTWAEDAPIDASTGDVFVGLDLAAHLVPQREAFLSELRARGVAIVFVVYDLLPVLRPDWFPDGLPPHFPPWLRSIARVADGLACISRAVAEELRDWLDAEQPQRQRPLRLGYFHLGVDVENSASSTGLPDDAGETLRHLRARPSFLMVGTVEPRKGHAQTLAAFERLWGKGHEVNLAIVGKQGWIAEALVERLRQHPEAGRRLFWLQGISDEYLDQIYAASTCLIAASEAEGFGLPLIEAARHRLPIIARDIPVFREVAGDHAFYFMGDKPEELAEAILQWLSLHAQGNAPKSDDLPWLTWQQSAKTLETLVMDQGHPQWTHVWRPGHRWRLRASDPRFQSQVGRRSPKGVHSQGSAGYLLYGPYIEVPAGNYELSLYGRAGTQGVDGAVVDVCAARGAQVLAKAPLQSDGRGIGQDTELARLAFRTEHVTSDLEIRVWTSETSALTVTSVEFSQVDNSTENQTNSKEEGK